MKTTRMGKDFCPSCNKILDGAASTENDRVPMPGDISVCFYCQTWLEYSSDMALVKLSEKTMRRLPHDTIHQLNTVTKLIKQQWIQRN